MQFRYTAVFWHLFTVASSAQPAPQPDSDAVAALCQDMFKKTADYLVGEFESELLILSPVYML